MFNMHFVAVVSVMFVVIFFDFIYELKLIKLVNLNVIVMGFKSK